MTNCAKQPKEKSEVQVKQETSLFLYANISKYLQNKLLPEIEEGLLQMQCQTLAWYNLN